MIGVVLAAGAGRRMGGPKARLVAFGAPLLEAHVRRLEQAGCRDVVVAVREGDERLAPHTVVSSAPDPAGSLRVALAAARGGEHELVVVTPVDALPARVHTIRALVRAARAPALAATPTFRRRGGHPVVVTRCALTALDDGRSLRDLLRALGERRVRVEVADAAVAVDLDEPADVLAATGAPPSFLD